MRIITRKEAKELGLKRFFTGVECKRGHLCERSVSRAVCIQCHNELTKRKYHENIEAEHARSAKYYAANKDRAAKYLKEYREKNKEEVARKRKEYKQKNKEAISVKMKEYHARVSAQTAERKKEYYRENRERYRAYVRNRRALTKGAEGHHSPDDIIAILDGQNWLCAEQTCRADLKKVKRHVDHIMPLALGGSNWPSNLQCLCDPCNRSKWAKHPDQWEKEKGRGK